MGIKLFTETDHFFFSKAMTLAARAGSENEVPVGAVLVLGNEIIGEGYNQPIKKNDPTAHAEILALRDAAKKRGNYRLVATTLYVTLEPCVMCAGALMQARIQRLVFGAFDQKAGAIVSHNNINSLATNHRIDCHGGLMATESLGLLQNFFRARR